MEILNGKNRNFSKYDEIVKRFGTPAIHDQKRFESFAIRYSQPAACRTVQGRSFQAKIGFGADLF